MNEGGGGKAVDPSLVERILIPNFHSACFFSVFFVGAGSQPIGFVKWLDSASGGFCWFARYIFWGHPGIPMFLSFEVFLQ